METRIFLYEYEHNGSKWSLEIPADNEEDAKLRIESIKNQGN